MNAIILSGGGGTRLWPMGRHKKPKQYFPIVSTKPMIVETYERLLAGFKPEHIFFSTNNLQAKVLRGLVPTLQTSHVIVEPEKRDTAPAMIFSALHLLERAPNEPFVFIPSDHSIDSVKRFIATLSAGGDLVRETGKLVDIGVQASFPSTALGYTHIGKRWKSVNGIEVYKFLGHTEKPDAETATRYIKSGEYLWHANYYMWTPRKFVDAVVRCAPELKPVIEALRRAIKEGSARSIKKLFAQLPKISIDYLLAEKLDPSDVLVIKGDFGWSDIGAWDALYDQLLNAMTPDGNIARGQVELHDTHNCLVYGSERKIIATIGLDNMIVVDTKDALLICPKGRAQDVKKIVAGLEQKGKKKFL
ncbi:MAG: Mannose-1-phosphate guanylyltransferase (GDP) [Candidatus Magasanikbacteria bacterium GW2011_GWA2_45_39]|uniref:Mannose-1-phosphate guanylyltransferase (GDP) n=1 Tax=Candidatus Magasanikbacteria bacterium GW2011_GWA2_45_39 TaxID=1619041 RepID=A0A0G1QE22_9BACT|nr:MAG: Mannose-1-phosphate guanylyltransferase (GDP) [Candidatus Magasanikbacteria bacterium GW2011_GWA2_45_39]